MKIKSIKSSQFAGLKRVDLSFFDGMNLIVGKNETGKSTLIELLYRLLFQNTKLDRRSDRDFFQRYFPAEKESGYRGDSIDGTVTLETPEGTFEIIKEWNRSGKGSFKLKTPEGDVIGDPKEADRILRENLLMYGQGIYSDIIFANQKRQDSAILALLGGGDQKNPFDVRQEIRSVVTKAVMETGGISVEEVEKAIQQKVEEYGLNWDPERSEPKGGKNKRGIRNKWRSEGTVLAAYYAREECAEKKEKAVLAESEAAAASERYKEAEEKKKEKDSALQDFLNRKSAIENAGLLNQRKKDRERKLAELENDGRRWPELEEKSRKASELEKELKDAKARETYRKVSVIRDQISEYRKKLEETGNISEEDYDRAGELRAELDGKERQLSGIDISAALHMLNGHQADVRRLSDGLPMDISSGEFSINEAVEISVPDVMKLSLAPAGVDAETLTEEIRRDKKELETLLQKNNADTFENLKKKYENGRTCNKELERLGGDLRIALGGQTEEALSEENSRIPEGTRTEAEIQKDISALCGREEIHDYAVRMKSRFDALREKYEGRDLLGDNIRAVRSEISSLEEKISHSEDLPDEYRNITDIDSETERLKALADEAGQERDEAQARLIRAENAAGEYSAEEISEELDKLTGEFEEAADTYRRWLHIQEVFLDVKNRMSGNPMQDIEENMEKYLTLLTDGTVRMAGMDENLDNVRITSTGTYMNYDILSEGTKDTISLAFRLAVLDHLFPDGGGLAVFDDPFTEMDPQRRRQACRLVRAFAERNQVIFVTCDSMYEQEDLLGCGAAELAEN